MNFRIGHGYDLHAIEESYGGVMSLGGLEIKANYNIIAHSDGDVILHAVCDSILGAIGASDIGQIFSDRNPQWSNCKSEKFLSETIIRMQKANYNIVNLDITYIGEIPKLSPHKESIREKIVNIISETTLIDISQINLKAKTSEKLGIIGQKQAIECHVVSLLASL